MKTEIKDYYNQLALEYDSDRFGNTYGQFIDAQEKAIVRRFLAPQADQQILDMGCGTGRFLEFANYGVDISPEMLKVARQKFPDKILQVAPAQKTPFGPDCFDKILCFHLLMHLDKHTVSQIMTEAQRILKPGGVFIFDVPSKHRRALTQTKAAGWHAANDFLVEEIEEMLQRQWLLRQFRGVLFFPVHRLPPWARRPLIWLDAWFCRSIWKKNASYLVFIVEKK